LIVHVAGAGANKDWHENCAVNVFVDAADVMSGACSCAQLHALLVETEMSLGVFVTPGDHIAEWLPTQVAKVRRFWACECAGVASIPSANKNGTEKATRDFAFKFNMDFMDMLSSF
jgi:hypothetical protein